MKDRVAHHAFIDIRAQVLEEVVLAGQLRVALEVVCHLRHEIIEREPFEVDLP